MKRIIVLLLIVLAAALSYWEWPGDGPGMYCGYVNGQYQCYSKG